MVVVSDELIFNWLNRAILGEDASVILTIEEMHTLGLKMFFNSLNCHASKTLEKVSSLGI